MAGVPPLAPIANAPPGIVPPPIAGAVPTPAEVGRAVEYTEKLGHLRTVTAGSIVTESELGEANTLTHILTTQSAVAVAPVAVAPAWFAPALQISTLNSGVTNVIQT